MCGRTSLFVPPDVLEERFDADLAVEYQPRYNIAPWEPLTTVRDDEPDVNASLPRSSMRLEEVSMS